MKNLLTLFLGILFLASVSNIKAQNIWDLQKCFDYALENNIQIKQQELGTLYGENQLKQAKSDKLPNLGANIGNNFSFGRNLIYPENTYETTSSVSVGGSVSTDMTLFNGRVLHNTVVQRELDLQATMFDLQKAKDDIMLAISAGYLEILFAEELELVTQANIEVTKQQLERTKQLVEAGSLAKGSLLEIEAQLAREELQLVNDNNRVKLAYLNLYQFLELPISENFKIEKPTLPEINAALSLNNAIDVFNTAMASRPEIKAAQLRVESANVQLDIAKGYRYPNLSIGANYNNQFFADDQSDNIPFGEQMKNNGRSGVGLNLNIPIFNRNQVKTGISNATLQIDDYKYRLQTARNVLRKDIEQAFTNAVASYNRFISTQKAVRSMEEAFRYVEEKFNVGMVNTVDYNLQKSQLTLAQSELLQAKYEYIFRSKILDFYNGIPIQL